ncbi:MAG: hypothetical protein RQ824_02610 [bacterium]|nr:hypothetical protein [bacterium]
MFLRRFSLTILFLLFSFTLISCQKEEKVVTKPLIAEDPLPEITADRLQLWFSIAPQLGHYIRKFALEGEAVNDKRDLLMLAHSSARTQMAYSEIFESNSMPTREFWNIIDEMERVKKYSLLKHEEKTQNVRIDDLIKAGIEELDSIRKKAESEISEEKRNRLNATVKAMELEIEELRELRGDLTPESVGIDEKTMTLAKANMDSYEKALAALWKTDGEARIKKIIDKNNNK